MRTAVVDTRPAAVSCAVSCARRLALAAGLCLAGWLLLTALSGPAAHAAETHPHRAGHHVAEATAQPDALQLLGGVVGSVTTAADPVTGSLTEQVTEKVHRSLDKTVRASLVDRVSHGSPGHLLTSTVETATELAPVDDTVGHVTAPLRETVHTVHRAGARVLDHVVDPAVAEHDAADLGPSARPAGADERTAAAARAPRASVSAEPVRRPSRDTAAPAAGTPRHDAADAPPVTSRTVTGASGPHAAGAPGQRSAPGAGHIPAVPDGGHLPFGGAPGSSSSCGGGAGSTVSSAFPQALPWLAEPTRAAAGGAGATRPRRVVAARPQVSPD